MQTDRRYRTFKPEYYTHFIGEENVIVGNAELVAIQTERGIAWVALCNTPIFNREYAITYATKLDKLIQFNKIRVATLRNKHK